MQIKTLLVKLARESCIACLSSLQERISMLQERPTELDMFMAYQVKCPTQPYTPMLNVLAHFTSSQTANTPSPTQYLSLMCT